MIAAQWGSEVIMLIMNELMLIILIIKLFKNVLICTTILHCNTIIIAIYR